MADCFQKCIGDKSATLSMFSGFPIEKAFSFSQVITVGSMLDFLEVHKFAVVFNM